MEISTLSLAVLAVFGCVLVLLPTTNAIDCFQCNSNDNDTCNDPFIAEERSDFLKACESGETYCRKVDQNVGGVYRIIRQCGTEKSKMSCIKRVGSKTVKMNYCSCDKDSCNSATSLRLGFLMQGVASIIMAYFVSLWVHL